MTAAGAAVSEAGRHAPNNTPAPPGQGGLRDLVAGGAAPRRTERILIAEDSPTQREMLRLALEAHGCVVSTAANGRDALDRLVEAAPTLVISDILMPELDGYGLCRAIKRHPMFARVPVVLLTTLANPHEVVAGLECGADHFIGKPYDEAHLLARLRHVIASRDRPGRDKGGAGVEIVEEGQTHLITAERTQIVDLLLSVYDMAMRRNDELNRAQARLGKLNGELEEKVRERTRQLEESNRSLETFCYSIAHDLRAPLRSISGFVTLLAEGYATQFDDTAREYVGRTVAAAGRMDKMIQDLLAYGRISHGEMRVQEVDLPRELRRLLVDFADEIAAKQADVRIDEACPVLWTSPILLTQVLANLLGNALKFVRPGVPPEIHLAARVLAGNRVTLSVADNGIGIDESYREKIFNVFEKAHSNPAYPGTGIGLAIVRKAVERMGGFVRVESTPGGGSTFIVELPLVAAEQG